MLQNELASTLVALSVEIGQWSDTNFGQQDSKWTIDNRAEEYIRSLYTRTQFDEIKHYQSGIRLGHLAPLLGLIEEIGELQAAVGDGSNINHSGMRTAEIRDACADIMIYMLDMVRRANLPSDIGDGYFLFNQPYIEHCLQLHPRLYIRTETIGSVTDFCVTEFLRNVDNVMRGLHIHAGKLVHCFLKRHQGIRGYDDEPKFLAEVSQHLSSIIVGLCLINHMTELDINQQDAAPHTLMERLLLSLRSVWSTVRTRNWKSAPATGEA